MASLPMHHIKPFEDCRNLLNNNKNLISRANEQGYLFFPGLYPKDLVLQLRHEIFQIAESYGFLKEGSDPDDGICREGVYIDLEYDNTPTREANNFYIDVLSLYSLNAFPHHECVQSILQKLLGETIFVHPRHIGHILFPGHYENTAEPHQDFHYVRGTSKTWTVWIPLGDIEIDLGGIAIAQESHKNGLLDDKLLSSGKLLNENTVWHFSPVNCGDVLMFHSLAIHQGCDNVSNDRIRLSTSARYQPLSEPIDAAALGVHQRRTEWSRIYAEWDSNDPLKYYWSSTELNIDWSYMENPIIEEFTKKNKLQYPNIS